MRFCMIDPDLVEIVDMEHDLTIKPLRAFMILGVRMLVVEHEENVWFLADAWSEHTSMFEKLSGAHSPCFVGDLGDAIAWALTEIPRVQQVWDNRAITNYTQHQLEL
jgi:hypothetical protein